MSKSGTKAHIEPDECIQCGCCEDECPCEAIIECVECTPETYMVNQIKCCCQDCGSSPPCEYVCPVEAFYFNGYC